MKVKVVADAANCTVHTSKNPEFGYIKLEQVIPVFKNNWLRNEVRTALIHGSLEELIAMDFKNGQELPGRIVIKESLQQTDSNDATRNLKYAGDTGVVCTVDDQPIYRTTYYSTNENEQDVFIQHTNTDEIKRVQAEAAKKLQAA